MNTLNINVGLLGHVDSGKTSLAKCLSTTSSTACFDKSPQSQERGITIDLGFSSFLVDELPDRLKGDKWKSIQYTLVDCPGHASLIKTVIGGVQIIDMMILVVDITKGIQTQTAECLIIGELMNKRMVVVLNKTDLIEPDKRQATIEKVKKKMKVTLCNTVFKDSPIVAVSANPGSAQPDGVEELKQVLSGLTEVPRRSADGVPMLFSVDHCFSIKGKGTIMTGTLLQGAIKINDEVEVVGQKKKVKSIERFRQSVACGSAGDRLGVCLTQFDPKLLERGLASTPGAISTMYAAIISLQPIRYYKSTINNKCKYHLTIGYETTLANLTLFTPPTISGASTTALLTDQQVFSSDKEYEYKDILEPEEFGTVGNTVFALLEPERPVSVWNGCMLIGSRLDADLHTASCRLVFSGRVLELFSEPDYRARCLPPLRIYKNKERSGTVHRIVSPHEIITTNLFKKQTDMRLFLSLKVELSTGESGFIDSTFGTTGKVKVRIPDGLKADTLERFNPSGGDNSKQKQSSVRVVLKFKKYIYDKGKAIHQN